jgi:uncharacterized membrane protein YgdD (TMEM256/DUF423 family)
MSTFVLVVREVIGLFIDDGSLAIAIIAVVMLAAMSAAVDGPALVTGGVLFVGCLVALAENIARTTRKD